MTTLNDIPSAELGSDRPAGPGGRGGRLGLVLKALVSVALLALLFAQADWTAIGGQLAGASPLLLAAGLAVKTLTIPFAALRWRAIAATAGVEIGRVTAVKVTLVGLLFGQVLPGALGADLARGWVTWRLGHSPSAVMMALVVDRLAALAGVAVLLAFGLPHLLSVAPPTVAWLLAAAVAACAVGMVGVLAFDRLPLPGRLRRSLLAGPIAAATRMRGSFTVGSGTVAVLYSLAVHMCTLGAVLIYAWALHLPVGVLDALAVVPFVIVAAALPLSLAGWGLREGSMVAGFALFGVPAEGALVVSVLIGLSVLLLALPSAVVWLTWRAETAAESRRAAFAREA